MVHDALNLLAVQMWNEGDWLFATPTGTPINPRTDYSEWKRLLSAAGVRDARLHDARHPVATVLLILGVPEQAVMKIMGWSRSAMGRASPACGRPRSMDIATASAS